MGMMQDGILKDNSVDVVRGGYMGKKRFLALLTTLAAVLLGSPCRPDSGPVPNTDAYDEGQRLTSAGRGGRQPLQDVFGGVDTRRKAFDTLAAYNGAEDIKLKKLYKDLSSNPADLNPLNQLPDIAGNTAEEKRDFVARRIADQKWYDNAVNEVLRSGQVRTEEEAIAYVNNYFYDPRYETLYNRRLDEQTRLRVKALHDVHPTAGRKVMKVVAGDLIGGWSSFYNKHQEKFNSLVKLSLLLSTATYIFNKLGGSEYVKNRIRELFNKPTVYTVRRRKAGLMKKQGDDLVKRSDLVLSAAVDRQISEIIFLINRRVEMAKMRKRKYAFPFILLYGPPGTGKTKIAQMIADQTIGDNGQPMNFIALMASDFMKIKDQGDRMDVLERMFNEANRLGNCIIFLDEVDGMTGQRGENGDNSNRAFLDKLLEKMATPSSRFMVIAATNHYNRIDDALLSRFRRKIYVGLPQPKVRQIILDKYVDKLLVNNGYKVTLDTAAIADVMKGDAGRDIEAFVVRLRDAIDYAGKAVVTQKDAEVVLRDMGRLPPLESDLNAPADLEDDLARTDDPLPERQDASIQTEELQGVMQSTQPEDQGVGVQTDPNNQDNFKAEEENKQPARVKKAPKKRQPKVRQQQSAMPLQSFLPDQILGNNNLVAIEGN